MKKNLKWITIVELVIVVIILTVLLTISFFSYQRYTLYSRDSVRVTDIKSLKTTLNLYYIDSSKFPKPYEPKDVTFNFNKIVWQQWKIDKDLMERVARINKVPLDPRYQNNYTYSVTEDWQEYQIWTILEASLDTSFNQPFINKALASQKHTNTNAYIDWNYNEVSLLFKMDWLYVMYAIPSIILPDLTWNLELSEMWTGSVVIRWKKCLPHSYKAYSDICTVDFTPNLLFIWSNLPVSEEDIMAVIEKIKETYSNPIFSDTREYDDISNTDTTSTWSSVELFGNILKEQIPDYIYDSWGEIVDIWVDEYIAQYWDIELISWSTSWWAVSPETGITFLNVNIFDEEWWTVNCNSCIDF